jgi:serine/threonine-protein kinase
MILFKLVAITGGLIAYIRFFARKLPSDRGSNTPTPLPADRKLGDYRILETIGIGGNATVYKAKTPGGETVAIKVPHLETLRQKGFLASFSREAQVGVNLLHPSIVRTIGTGEFLDSSKRKVPFFVMEYLEGQDLETRLREEGRLDPKEAAQISRIVADALSWAHHRGIQHRDISPKNIFLTKTRQVKVMDFGISTVFKRGEKIGKAGSSLNFGTPEYLAPERTSRTDADCRSDLYSLGCVLYHMVTGRPPFSSENPRKTLMLHRKQPVIPPTSLANCPKPLEDIILKLLAKDPEKRYQDAGQVTAALADLVPAV